jgi:DNA-binding transcriptional MerR regulator
VFGIGEFARHGRISEGMVTHYDAIGLLQPARVDPLSGERYYEAAQLSDLNRLAALKDLGFTPRQIRDILSERVTLADLWAMLRLRQAETVRLARAEARLLTLEAGQDVLSDDVVVKRLAPVQVAELTGIAASYHPLDITPVIGSLYCDLWLRLADAGIAATTPRIAYYEDTEPGTGAVVVHAAVAVTAGPADSRGYSVMDLPEVDQAAMITHYGSMDDVLPTAQALACWIDANGYQCVGYPREVTLEWSPDREQWVTELQQPICRRS